MSNNALKPLLVVEDNPGVQKQLKWSFEGYHVVLASDRVSALKQIKQVHPSVVTLDLGLPPDPTNASEGLAALTEILELAPYTKVIVVTGNDDRKNALKAVSLGAYDFYQKPIDPDVLGLIVDRAYNLYELEEENRDLAKQKYASPTGNIVGDSPQMQQVCRMLEKVGPSDVTTLILGESGTGKELFAQALHTLSRRKDKPFVAVNCAAIPENLLESELFGYEKGAFTGAVKRTRGKVEYADGGTLFLDEIGDMPVPLQAKMLRFLQERIIEPIGSRKTIQVDVRILCATHQDLDQRIQKQEFREDLYYRISGIVLEIPPLRERDGDLILLARTFLEQFNRQYGKKIRGFSESALGRIEHYAWPGNVRELENKVKRAIVLADSEWISVADLGFTEEADAVLSLNLKQARENAERRVIRQSLAVHNNNISRAASAIGVSRPSLYNLMKKLEMVGIGED
ncbi:MAG: PEP-CTERM-box response regulator transcription factor [Gammaproteobacteria bacterium]|nr:PEP-CTERM-box response regulator transcription factor [Gammaproteobacteria bacterium]